MPLLVLPHGRVPCDHLYLLCDHPDGDGQKRAVAPCIGVLALVDSRRPEGLDAGVMPCPSSVFCRSGNSLFWILVLPPNQLDDVRTLASRFTLNRSPHEMVAEHRLHNLKASISELVKQFLLLVS